MDARELIGKRVLIQRPRGYGGETVVDEYKVLEVSPSGNWTKLMDIHGKKFWRTTATLTVTEDLASLEAHPESWKGQIDRLALFLAANGLIETGFEGFERSAVDATIELLRLHIPGLKPNKENP